MTYGKKGHKKKIFQYYVIQGVGAYVERNDVIMIYHIASSKFLSSEVFVVHAILP